MKNSWTNDERVKRGNGAISHPRVIVVEGLEVQGKAGATLDELVALIGQDMKGDNPKSGIAKTLHGMLADDYLIYTRGRWYLKEYAPAIEPATVTILPHANGKIAPMVQKRSGKAVSIFTSPREMVEVVRVSLVIKGVTVPIPLWGNMWICYGQTTPDWDAEKETYYNVETIRLLMKNGQQHEEHPSPSDTVTIAQG